MFDSRAEAHVDEDVLDEYLFRRLNELERTRVEEHGQACRACRQQFADYQEFVMALRVALQASLTAPLSCIASRMRGEPTTQDHVRAGDP